MQYTLFSRLSICFLALSFAGCAELQKNIQTPSVQFAGIEPKNASLYETTVDFLIHVENPNPISLPVQALSYSVDINGKKMLSGSAQPGIQIPAKAGTDLRIPVEVRYEEFLNGLQELMHKDSLGYSIKGDIDLGFFKLPYEAGGTIPLPKLPQIQLKTINVNKFAFDGIEAAMRLSIKNANDFPLKAGSLSYELLLNKIATVSGESAKAIDVAPKSDSTLEIITRFSLLELGRVLETFKQGNSVNATLTGQIEIPVTDSESKSIPFSWSGETPIMR